MIHLGDGQDIFLLMLSLSPSNQSAACLHASLALSHSLPPSSFSSSRQYSFLKVARGGKSSRAWK